MGGGHDAYASEFIPCSNFRVLLRRMTTQLGLGEAWGGCWWCLKLSLHSHLHKINITSFVHIKTGGGGGGQPTKINCLGRITKGL